MTQFYRRRGKRALDLALGSAALIISAPIHLASGAAVLLTSGRPIYFHQTRAGRNGVPFQIKKLRTMTVGTEQRYSNYPTVDAVTPVGRFLRRTSLDEIPQLINILRGEMSFVGPRPALPSQVDRYSREQAERLLVRPGVTGIAQIRYRNQAPWSVRIEADREYVRRLSLRFDVKILLATVPAVLFGTGQVVGQSVEDVDDLASPPSKAPYTPTPREANRAL